MGIRSIISVLLSSLYVANASLKQKVYGGSLEAEAFSAYADPRNIAKDLGEDFVFQFESLPLQGQPDVEPWSSTYWPVYLDSVNYRWAGAKIYSPIEKWELAFNATGLTKAVSQRWGKNSAHYLKNSDGTPVECSTDDDCPGGSTQAACVTRDLSPKKVCIAKWYGLCHAWAPAAMVEKPPKKQVVVNGILFDINDLLALTILSYDYMYDKDTNGVKLRWYSRTCNTFAKDMKFDKFGRPLDDDCRDMNAGAFHIIMTNFLGISGKPFFINKNMDREIWNQPVDSFKVNSYKTLDYDEARAMMDGNPNDDPFSSDAVSFIYVNTDLTYISESNPRLDTKVVHRKTVMELEYILEINSDGEIIGGEWIHESIVKRPGYVVFYDSRKDNGTSFNGLFQWSHLSKMLALSRDDE